MDQQQVRAALDRCAERLRERYPYTTPCKCIHAKGANKAQHVLWMCDEAKKHQAGKAFRWLGFIEGWLWAEDTANVNEMREWNTAPPHNPERGSPEDVFQAASRKASLKGQVLLITTQSRAAAMHEVAPNQFYDTGVDFRKYDVGQFSNADWSVIVCWLPIADAIRRFPDMPVMLDPKYE